MKVLNVSSEIGKLKTVMLHRPGGEIENLTPKWLESLLFDDIPWLDKARIEHDTFASVFKKAGVKVVYLSDLVAEALNQAEDIKRQFIKQFISEAQVTSETLAEVIADYLWKFPSTKAMVEKTMAGILKMEVPNFVVRTLSDHIRDYPFVTDPMPNLYFTRDPFSVIGHGVAISKMSTLTRSRETIYADYVFKYHPFYKKTEQFLYGRDELSSIEGGDILILTDKILAVGVSQRTHPSAIEKLAKNLFYKYETSFEKVLAFDIPKGRAFMHLDTVLTQVDHGKFVIHSELTRTIKVYELTRDPKRFGKLHVKPIEQSLQKILDTYLNTKVTLMRLRRVS